MVILPGVNREAPLGFLWRVTRILFKGGFLVILLSVAVDTLRNIWLNWGANYPFLSSLAVAVVAVIAWWTFGGIVMLSERRISPQPPVTVEASADEWPGLTNEQIDEWVTALRPHKLHSIAVLWSADINARKLYKTFKEVATRLGVEINTGLGGTNYQGIEVLSAPDDPSGEIILELIKRHLSTRAILNHEGREGRNGVVLILVGDKT